VSDSDTSKSKPLAHKQSYNELAVVVITGLIPCILLDGYLTLVLIALAVVFRQLFRRWLELMIYLVVVVFAQNGLPVLGAEW